MNEVGLIRAQLALERAHARSAAAAAAAATQPAFRAACAAYLEGALAASEAREARFARLHPAGGDAAPAAALASPGAVAGARACLTAAVAGGTPEWQALAACLAGPWTARAAALEAALDSGDTLPWRALSGIDADKILEERRRFAALLALWPADLPRPTVTP